MNTLKGYVLLTRPLNLLIAFLSIFIGGFVTGTIHPLLKLGLACFSGAFIMAGANAVNDFFDRKIDSVNKPARPIPAGMVSPNGAYVFAILLFHAGIVLSAFIHTTAVLIACASSILVFLYSYRLKRTVLWGNLTVALVTGMSFVYGGLAVGRIRTAAIVGVFAFFYHLAREIMKDVEDIAGDSSQAAGTLPVRHGIKVSLAAATSILIVLIVLTFMPYILEIFSLSYLLTVILGVDVFLLFVIVAMWRKPEPAFLGKLAFWMKLDMFMGLLAVYLGS